MFHISCTRVIVPVLFVLAAAFYAKLGYIALVGCCNSQSNDKVFEELETKLKALESELNGTNMQNDIDSKLSSLAEKLAELQDKIINKERQEKDHIDFIRKEIESMQTDGVTYGGENKRSNVKDSLINTVLLVLLILQVCFIFGARYIYRKTKELESRLLETNDKKIT